VKIEKLIARFSVALLAVLSAEAQGTFQNLDFESANLSPVPPQAQPPTYVPISSALPGWNATIGGVAVTQVLQNDYDTGTASVDILGPNWSPIDPGIIGGNYTVFLQSGGSPQNDSIGVNTSIWQDGTVPANAQSLEFSAWNRLPSFTIFTVSFDGNDLSPVALYSGQTAAGQPYTVYGANIAPYAGETGQLEFTSVFNPGGASWTELDDIAFSTQAVPEPSPVILTGIGSLLLLLCRRWFRRTSS
jgi:hypothetical protein